MRYTNRKFAMKIYLEMYRSGRNENDSKSNWLFGSGFPVLLGFMRVFRLREGTIFWRSLLQFSPKFSQNARRILKFNIWSITQVVVRGRTRNAIGRETGARVRLPDAPPNRMDRWILFVCPFFFAETSPVHPVFGAYGIMLTHCHSPAPPSSPVQTRAWKRNRGGRKYWR